jgi:toxin-antitoxin system PIN domain toxin
VFVVDTNILVYAAGVDLELHAPCRNLLETWVARPSPWYITWGIVYEFLSVTTQPRVFREPWPLAQSWQFVASLLASPSLGFLIPTDRHAAVAAEVFGEIPHLRGRLLHDAETAVLMREHGIRRIYTRDTHFHRFPFLEPIDPLAKV